MITKNMTRKAYRKAYWLDLGILIAVIIVGAIMFSHELHNFLLKM